MVSEKERSALLKFRLAARGELWPERLRWDPDADPAEWYGVRLDVSGRVVGLEVVFEEQEREAFQTSNGFGGLPVLRTDSPDWSVTGSTDDRERSDSWASARGEDYGGYDSDKVLSELIESKFKGPSNETVIRDAESPKETVIRDVESSKETGSEFFNKIDLSPSPESSTKTDDQVTSVPAVTPHLSPELSELENLEVLRLSFLLGDVIPESLSRLKRIQKMDLSANRLSGPIPEALGLLRSLEALDMSDNRLSGPIPNSLGQLGRLLTVDLSNNWLSGKIPVSLGRLVILQYMDLNNNDLSGEVPEWLGQLRSLRYLDLSHNGLSGAIPKSMGMLESLQVMDLHSNSLSGEIPESLGQLGSLQKMHLWYNSLSGAIPESLGKLRVLQDINLNSNDLSGAIPESFGQLKLLQRMELHINELSGSIPESLGQLGFLEEMVLHVNKLSGSIPASLGQLRRLKCMHLGYNELSGAIPASIWKLGNLSVLNLRSNKLTEVWDHLQDVGSGDTRDGSLPKMLKAFLERLKGLDSTGNLFLSSNNFKAPPQAVVESGIEAIEDYFSALFADDTRIQRHDTKAVLIGQEGAGKTSLRQSIRDGRASPTSGWEESTVHIDVESMDVEGVSLSLYDCAGQVAYYGLLQMFLTRRAVCLLVCNAKKFMDRKDSPGGDHGTDEEKARRQLYQDVEKLEELRVCEWLRCLSWRVPGCDVILVATKCDRVPVDAVDNLAERIERACRFWLEKWTPGSVPVNVEEGVSRTSCARGPDVGEATRSTTGGCQPWLTGMFGCLSRCQPLRDKATWSIDWVSEIHGIPSVSLLQRIVHKPGEAAMRGATMVVPFGWDIALTVIDSLTSRRDPLRAVRQKLGLHVGSGQVEREEVTKVARGITTEKLTEKWLHVVNTLRSDNTVEIFSPERALEGALCIREFEGRLLRESSQVFLDVTWLTSMLKPVLSHVVIEVPNGDIYLGEVGTTEVVLQDDRHKDSWKRLEGEGILEPELANVLWPDGLAEQVLKVLASLGLIFELPEDEHGGLVVLLRMKKDRPESVGQELRSFRHKHSAALKVEWTMNLGVPHGAVERVLARCSSLGTTRTFWRFGVLVQRDLQGDYIGGTFTLLLEYSEAKKKLLTKVYGNRDSVAPWAVLFYAMSAMQSMLLEFPGLPWKACFFCPHHNREIKVSRKAHLLGDRLLDRERRCKGCDLTNGGPGEFALQLATMIDVTWPSGVLFQEVKDRVDKLQEEYPVFFPEDTRVADSKQLETLVSTLRDTGREKESIVLEGIFRKQQQEDAQPTQALVQEVLDFLKSDDGVQRGLGPVTSALKAILGDRFDTPRLACILPPWDFELDEGLSDSEKSPLGWTRRLGQWEADDFKGGTGWFTKSKRLFLVCAHTYRLVACGEKGQGYEIRALRTWLKRTIGGASIMLEVLSTTLGKLVGANLPATVLGELAGVGMDTAREKFESAVLDNIERLTAMDGGEHAEEMGKWSSSQGVNVLTGKAYEALQDFVQEAEEEARNCIFNARRKAKSIPKFVFFENEMEKVEDLEGDAVVHWVQRGQADAWKADRQSRRRL